MQIGGLIGTREVPLTEAGALRVFADEYKEVFLIVLLLVSGSRPSAACASLYCPWSDTRIWAREY